MWVQREKCPFKIRFTIDPSKDRAKYMSEPRMVSAV